LVVSPGSLVLKLQGGPLTGPNALGVLVHQGTEVVIARELPFPGVLATIEGAGGSAKVQVPRHGRAPLAEALVAAGFTVRDPGWT
jgi:hypothetical protein